MGVLSNKVDKSMLNKGDHIYSYRKAHLYSNHGQYDPSLILSLI